MPSTLVPSRVTAGNGVIVKKNSRGVVRWFNVEKGFGFATDEDESLGDVFIHRANILVVDQENYKNGVSLVDGSEDANVYKHQRIEYDILKHTSGNLQCKNITGVGGKLFSFKKSEPPPQPASEEVDDLVNNPEREYPWKLIQAYRKTNGDMHLYERMVNDKYTPTGQNSSSTIQQRECETSSSEVPEERYDSTEKTCDHHKYHHFGSLYINSEEDQSRRSSVSAAYQSQHTPRAGAAEFVPNRRGSSRTNSWTHEYNTQAWDRSENYTHRYSSSVDLCDSVHRSASSSQKDTYDIVHRADSQKPQQRRAAPSPTTSDGRPHSLNDRSGTRPVDNPYFNDFALSQTALSHESPPSSSQLSGRASYADVSKGNTPKTSRGRGRGRGALTGMEISLCQNEGRLLSNAS